GIAPGRLAPAGAQLRDLAGTVLDADEGTPIARARVALTSGPAGERIELVTGEDGRFAIARLEGESWSLEVSASGYEPRTATLKFPHRGQWSAATVRLRSLREVALAHYRPVAEALAPAPAWWAFWTPRELAERADGARDEVKALTS